MLITAMGIFPAISADFALPFMEYLFEHWYVV